MEGKQEGKAFFNVECEDRPGKKGSYPGRGVGKDRKTVDSSETAM